MKILEHRRHSMRTDPGQHLSQQGVTLARRVGDDMGPFDLVVTSPLPRAFETAIAMGFAVDATNDVLAKGPRGSEAAWMGGFGPMMAFVETRADGTARWLDEVNIFLTEIVDRLPENGRALLVSHGGIVEMSAMAVAPEDDLSGWGAPLSYCEGIRLTFDGPAPTAELIRVG